MDVVAYSALVLPPKSYEARLAVVPDLSSVRSTVIMCLSARRLNLSCLAANARCGCVTVLNSPANWVSQRPESAFSAQVSATIFLFRLDSSTILHTCYVYTASRRRRSIQDVTTCATLPPDRYTLRECLSSPMSSSSGTAPTFPGQILRSTSKTSPHYEQHVSIPAVNLT